jgi:hypothetical protein
MEWERLVDIKGKKGAGWCGIHRWIRKVVSWWIIQTNVSPNKKDVTWFWVGLDQYKMKPTHYLMEMQVQGKFSLLKIFILIYLNQILENWWPLLRFEIAYDERLKGMDFLKLMFNDVELNDPTTLKVKFQIWTRGVFCWIIAFRLNHNHNFQILNLEF